MPKNCKSTHGIPARRESVVGGKSGVICKFMPRQSPRFPDRSPNLKKKLVK